MIKKLQAFRAKKGFTLVELIVVIAIIGILAAILIPMMMGYVQSANITAADANAQSAKNSLSTTLSSLEAKGATVTASAAESGTSSSGSGVAFGGCVTVEVTVTNGAKSFDVTLEGIKCTGKNPSGGNWDDKAVSAAIQDEFTANLADMDAGYIRIFMDKKNPVQAVFTTDAATIDSIDAPITSWVKGQIGVIDGVIVGTNDKVNAENTDATKTAITKSTNKTNDKFSISKKFNTSSGS